jgi:outer membrane protein assembly factor BamB
VIDGAVIVNADGLIALDALTGKERWRQAGAGGNDSSPVVWKAEGMTFVIVNGRKELHAINSRSGSIAWSAPGGGPCTPAIADDVLALQAKAQGALVAYRLAPHGATKLWNHPIEALRYASSPIISGSAVYLMDQNVHCCIDLGSGRECWREPAPCEIASPVLADGKLFVMANQGNTLMILQATPDARIELGKATVRAQWVPSPCISDGRLVLRMHDKLKCWSLLP